MTFIEAYESIQKNYPTLPLEPRLDLTVRLRQATAKVNPDWVIGEAVVFDTILQLMEQGFTLGVIDQDDPAENPITGDLFELFSEATACDINYMQVEEGNTHLGNIMFVPENEGGCISDWSYDPDNDKLSPILEAVTQRWDRT